MSRPTSEGHAGGPVSRESSRGKTAVVWTCPTEERCWVYWEKDAEDGAAPGTIEETGNA